MFIIKFRLKPHNARRIEPIHSLTDHGYRIQSLAFSPKDTYLAVGCTDGSLDIYDVKNKFKSLKFKNYSK